MLRALRAIPFLVLVALLAFVVRPRVFHHERPRPRATTTTVVAAGRTDEGRGVTMVLDPTRDRVSLQLVLGLPCRDGRWWSITWTPQMSARAPVALTEVKRPRPGDRPYWRGTYSVWLRLGTKPTRARGSVRIAGRWGASRARSVECNTGWVPFALTGPLACLS